MMRIIRRQNENKWEMRDFLGTKSTGFYFGNNLRRNARWGHGAKIRQKKALDLKTSKIKRLPQIYIQMIQTNVSKKAVFELWIQENIELHEKKKKKEEVWDRVFHE